ncbi:MAG: ABC transporter substrate-binding protein [Gallionellales bacterium RIFCSPLOWO2_12_FULL_59_22]|nr:MAG: ABC transporter substrate-binding protein [Gallionellales bacterium RIFCSPLOWO2_02_FULL_59_110]OGT03744.1 MAG: ABC transporter substrate-binding protein [Gallionellales bacterium RIFCSPLOWO2_02_58_13]OGT14244.1 MAG: ABC transporter substrate-binding protein [Gallionellales bacterium RIFCSPLOWO2_12_FULL_59_22]
MLDVLAIASRNLLRYRRRTLLTLLLIVIGMVAVLLFVAVAGSFKAMMVGQFTDSVLGHLQVHRKGYVASIDNLPLNLNMSAAMVAKTEEALKANPLVETWSPRIKFGGMFSNFAETTSIRINGIDPAREAATVPLLPGRLIEGDKAKPLVERGNILIPVLLARGMNTKVGDTVVVVATNRDGSVNGKTFVVQGILEGVTGPGGRDGYMHIDDARALLRMSDAEISEVAVRLKDFSRLGQADKQFKQTLGESTNKEGKQTIEVHTWAELSPFANLARMIDLMTLFIKIMLVSIVLVSVMNVMMMAVFERIREIGTIAAIGTPPGRILSLFLAEGLMLGVVGTAAGIIFSLAAIFGINVWSPTFAFGQQQNLVMAPTIAAGDVLAIAAMVVAVAVLASLQPAWKASRMDPISALRHV